MICQCCDDPECSGVSDLVIGLAALSVASGSHDMQPMAFLRQYEAKSGVSEIGEFLSHPTFSTDY